MVKGCVSISTAHETFDHVLKQREYHQMRIILFVPWIRDESGLSAVQSQVVGGHCGGCHRVHIVWREGAELQMGQGCQIESIIFVLMKKYGKPGGLGRRIA